MNSFFDSVFGKINKEMESAELGRNEDLVKTAVNIRQVTDAEQPRINQGDLEICILESKGEHMMKSLNYRPLFSRTVRSQRGRGEQREGKERHRYEWNQGKSDSSHHKVHVNYLITQRKPIACQGNPVKIFSKPPKTAKAEKSQ